MAKPSWLYPFSHLALLSAWSLIPLTIGCTDFTNEPRSPVAVGQAESWPAEMLVQDTDTLAIEVTLPNSTTVTGLEVNWKSDDTDVLDVVELQPAQQTREDSLTSQLRAVVHAGARGSAELTVTIEGGADFEQVEYRATVLVRERWIAISAGRNHTCAIAISQEAYCWGAGTAGALGNGRSVNSLVPSQVFLAGNPRISSIAAGEFNTCATIIQDIAYCWGFGELGRLGNGSEMSQFIPVQVSLGRTWKSLSAGGTSCGITSASELFCWGSNSHLQLGAPRSGLGFDICGAVECSLAPLGVRTALGDTLFFSTVDVGTFHVCGITTTPFIPGKAYCWGSGFRIPATLDTLFLLGDSIFQSQIPSAVGTSATLGQALTFQSLSAGTEHTCGVTTSGDLYCWGSNERGQLGIGAAPSMSARPIAAGDGLEFALITAGGSHTCGLTTGGQAYCWGANDFGQLGTDSPSTAPQTQPTLVAGGYVFAHLSAGGEHTCGIIDTGAAYCWGANPLGELGTTATTSTCTTPGLTTPCAMAPIRVADPAD